MHLYTYIQTYRSFAGGTRDGISYTNSIKIDISLLVGAIGRLNGQDAYMYMYLYYILTYIIREYMSKPANED